MIGLGRAALKIYVALEPCDMRKSFNGLFDAAVRHINDGKLGTDMLFVFTNSQEVQIQREPELAPACRPRSCAKRAWNDVRSRSDRDDHRGLYFYHDPQYRQSARFLMRFGAILSCQTLNQWTHAGMDLLAPVGEAILRELRLAEFIQADETPMSYLDPGHGSTSQGYLWWYRDAASGTAYCDWQLGRGHNCLIELLGLDDEAVICNVWMIQCDGYSAYEALANRYREILLAACLAHIRRKFIEALAEAPEETGEILPIIRRLYRIERQLRNTVATATCRMLVRQGHAPPLVKQLKEKILAEHGRNRPRSKFGEALGYALGQWDQFERYLGEGLLEIDNNLTENLIRPSNLGLKNYLFFGSAEAGSSSALIYTLIANCRVQGIDPERYLAEAMRRLSPDTTPEQAAELTPAKLAPLIRQLQPRPACADEPCADALESAA